MLVSPAKATSIIIGYERTINDGLMQLACAYYAYQGIPRESLIDMLAEIADLRFGSDPIVATRPCGFYSGPLFWEVFGYGGVMRLENVAYRLACQQRRFNVFWIDRELSQMAEALRTFHTNYARGCEDGILDRAKIDGLIHNFISVLRS